MTDTAFTIYQKHPTLDAYRYGPSYTPYAIVAVHKRFTDAELAAEFWAAAIDANQLMGSPRRSGKSHAANVAMTLHRFATLPHAHETNYE